MVQPFELIKPTGWRWEQVFLKKKDCILFGKETLTNELKDEEKVINLASKEYSSVINFKDLDGVSIIEPRFEDWSNGSYKVVSVHAKKARGTMARWLISNLDKSIEEFAEDGYVYTPGSDKNSPLYRRRYN